MDASAELEMPFAVLFQMIQLVRMGLELVLEIAPPMMSAIFSEKEQLIKVGLEDWLSIAPPDPLPLPEVAELAIKEQFKKIGVEPLLEIAPPLKPKAELLMKEQLLNLGVEEVWLEIAPPKLSE